MRNEFTQRVLDEIDIIDLITENVTLDGNKKTQALPRLLAKCPFPDHHDTAPSFRVYPNTQSFFCFGCKRGGTAIDFIMYLDGVQAGEAIRILCEWANIPLPTWTKEEKEKWEKQKSEKDIVTAILHDAFKIYHDEMDETQQKGGEQAKPLSFALSAWDYWRGRGLTDETIKKELLGYAPDDDTFLFSRLKEKYTVDELLLSGLFVKTKDGIKDAYQRRYIIPYWHQSKCVYSIGRLDTNDENEIAQLPDWNKGKYKKHLTHNEKHPYVSETIENVIWNADSAKAKDYGIITEGIIDALLAKQAGFCVVSPVTTKFAKKDIERLCKLSKHWETVYIINDNETSGEGERGALQTAEAVFKDGGDARLVTLPLPEGTDKIDLADFLNVPDDQREPRIDELRSLMDEAPDFIEWKIDEATELPERQRPKATRDIFSLLVNVDDLELERYANLLKNKKLVIGKRLFEKALKDAKNAQQETTPIEGPQFGSIYEVDGYDTDGERQLGYLKYEFPQKRFISTFVIKPQNKLWIDGYEAVNATFLSVTQEIKDVVIERKDWNSPDSFMGVIPSTNMNWSGTDRKDVQAVMSIVDSYDVPTQIATKQVGWHKENSRQKDEAKPASFGKPFLLWVAPHLNIGKDGIIHPAKVFYYPMGEHNAIDDIVSYDECDDSHFATLQGLAKTLLELNESDVTIPIIGWFHGAFAKRWWLNHPNLRHFPHLNISGSRGSGKSTLTEILWQVFGWTGDALMNCSASRFALLRMFSSTNSFPIVLDEYKPSNMPKDRIANLREFMRQSYGGAIDQRGRPDQSIVEYHLTAPICLAGELSFYLSEAAAIERVIPVHTTINAINPETEAGERRSELCYELQQVDWKGYLPRYIRYLLTIDFNTELEHAREDAARYLGDRDVPRRIWDNIAAMIFGLRQYEVFASMTVDDAQVEHAVQTIATHLCGVAGKRGKLAFEMALEQMAVMAETGRLLYETHFLINENDEICLRLSACLSEFRRFARETNWTGEVLDDSSYRRQIAEIHEEGELIVETTQIIRGWQGNWNKRARAVIIDGNASDIDLSGFLLAKRDEDEDDISQV